MGKKMSLQILVLQAIVGLIFGCFMMAPLVGQEKNSDQPAPVKRMTPELLWKLGRLGEATLSPDGKQVVYSVRKFDLESNEGSSNLYVTNVGDGKTSLIVKQWKSIGSLHWKKLEQGERIFFEGTPQAPAAETESVDQPKNQAWSIDPVSLSLTQLTAQGDGIANLNVAPDGKRIAFTMRVKLLAEPNEIYPDLPKADARIIDQLMYRHWNQWHDYKFSHIHVANIGEGGQTGDAIDLMKDIKADCPIPPFGGAEQFGWSPDSKEIVFAMKDVKDWAQSTNSDVYVVASDGASAPKNISGKSPGYDRSPVYSPDGKYIAYNSMERAGFESDRNRIMVYDRGSGKTSELTVGLDPVSYTHLTLPTIYSV